MTISRRDRGETREGSMQPIRDRDNIEIIHFQREGKETLSSIVSYRNVGSPKVDVHFICVFDLGDEIIPC